MAQYLQSGLGLQAVGLVWLVWLAVIATPDLSYAVMVVPLVVSGIGCSAALPVSQTAIVGSVGGDDVGKAAGANNMTWLRLWRCRATRPATTDESRGPETS